MLKETSLKIVFFGSDDFAAAHLPVLLDAGYDVAACVTPPDKPRGRGMPVEDLPVKRLAQSRGVTVFQPPDLRSPEIAATLAGTGADLFVVIAYGRLLPQKILDIPSRGAVNVHGSLLPKYRGAAPVNWAIINGETETGVSVIQMNARMDAGDILGRIVVPIDARDTSVSLRRKLMEAGQRLLPEIVEQIAGGRAAPVKQDDARATLAPKLTRELGRIDWRDSAENICNKIRGLQPWPGVSADCQGKPLGIISARVEFAPVSGRPGEIIEIKKEGILVATGRGALLAERVHPAGGRPMGAFDFANGRRLAKGFRF
jgi:methionyl-tRNA formyltransferase